MIKSSSGAAQTKVGSANTRLSRFLASSWAKAGGLMLLALVIYWPCLNGPFLFDDNEWIIDMQHIYQSLDGLKNLWLVPGTSQQYYPLTATSFWIDYQLWGLNTLPYHLENVLLHGLSAVLFWRLLRQLGIKGAFFAAALFAAHPMMVESVAWITERRNVLCQALILAAGLAYGRSRHGWRREVQTSFGRWWWLAFALFTAAVLAKITAFVFPAALLVIIWWKNGQVQWRRDVLPVLPMFVISIIAGLGIYWMETQQLGAKGSGYDMSFPSRLALSSQVIWFYFGKLLWPHPVCVIYYRWMLDPSLWWQWSGFAACLLVAAVLWRKKASTCGRGLFTAALIFAGMLFPLLGFLNVAGMLYSWVADRWVYMPSLAVFAGLGHLWDRLPLRSAGLRLALVSILLIVCSNLSWRQAATYRSVDAFWQAAIADNPKPWKARSDYAVTLITDGRLNEAVRQLEKALSEHPGAAEIHGNLGGALHGMGRHAEALDAYQRALELQPDSAHFHYNMALIYQYLGRNEEMAGQFQRTVELSPDFLPAYYELGNYYFKMGNSEKAELHYRNAISLKPQNPEFLTLLGNVLFWKGQPQEAIALYKESLALDQNLVTTLGNYAFTLISTMDPTLRDVPYGIKLAERAAQLSERQDAGILSILADAHARAGSFFEAAEAARTAARVADQQGNPELAARNRQKAAAYAEGRLVP